MEIHYSSDREVTIEQFIDVLQRSTLAERRPVEDYERISQMLAHANLTCTAWDGALLVGVARSLTDFSFCCYLSDLAVDSHYQRKGIGQELVRITRRSLHPQCKIVLLSAPQAEQFYPRIGFSPHHSAWVLP